MTKARLLVIGDIHGMYDELRVLLRSAGFDPEADTLVVLGDYIDRGSQSRSVIEFFMDLKTKYGSRVTLLRGNHEDLCLKAHQGDGPAGAKAISNWLANSGDITLRSFGGLIPAEVIAFMKKMRFYAETEEYIFVHAGVHPSLPLSKNNSMDLIWSGSSQPHFSGKMVIVGHVIRDEVTYDPKTNILYIDTGAFQGAMGRTGRLSMVDLTNKKVHWVNTGGIKPGTYHKKELVIHPSL